MELRQLRYFTCIVDHGSLSRAARVLHIAQPALTQQIRQLEDELGAQLLHRSAQGVLATEAGRIFYEHAQAILKQVGDAKSAVTQTGDRPAGTVALGVPQSMSGAIALPLLSAVRATFPEIVLNLTEELTGNLTEQLRSGRLNLALLFEDGQLGAFAATPLAEERMMYIAKQGSPFLPKGKKISLARAATMPLILPSPQHGVRPLIEGVVREAGIVLENVIEITSVAILKSALQAGIGATILPVAPLLAEVERGEFVALPIDGAPLARKVMLCASKNIPLTAAGSAVAKLVQQLAQELCASGRWIGARSL